MNDPVVTLCDVLRSLKSIIIGNGPKVKDLARVGEGELLELLPMSSNPHSPAQRKSTTLLLSWNAVVILQSKESLPSRRRQEWLFVEVVIKSLRAVLSGSHRGTKGRLSNEIISVVISPVG